VTRWLLWQRRRDSFLVFYLSPFVLGRVAERGRLVVLAGQGRSHLADETRLVRANRCGPPVVHGQSVRGSAARKINLTVTRPEGATLYSKVGRLSVEAHV